jgi:uncharacterized BrkB/YihY/UPF0761 family membrane protein
MSRTAIALLLAPALVPIVMLTDLSAYATAERWFLIYVVVATLFSYVGVLGLGAPILLFVWSRNCTALWATVLIGIAVSVVTWLLFGFLFGLILGHSMTESIKYTAEVSFLKGLLWPAGVCGVIVASAIWAIARPDRRRSQHTPA